MKDKNQEFLKELESYEKLGVHIVLEGTAATAQEIYKTCMMREDMSYMCDFIFKDDKKLAELHFNKVKEQ